MGTAAHVQLDCHEQWLLCQLICVAYMILVPLTVEPPNLNVQDTHASGQAGQGSYFLAAASLRFFSAAFSSLCVALPSIMVERMRMLLLLLL